MRDHLTAGALLRLWSNRPRNRRRAITCFSPLLAVVILAGPAPTTAQDFPDWFPSPANPILPSASPLFTAPTVLKEAGLYRVWGGTSGQLYHATSTDGVNWSSPTPLAGISPGAPGDFDQSSLFGAAVLFNPAKGLYEMWYTGQKQSGLSDYRIGYASSPDGLNWTKSGDETNPNNAVIDKGGPGSGEEGLVSQPVVLLDSGIYKMWYSGSSIVSGNSNFGVNGVFYAESSDGMNWTKKGKVIEGGPSGSDTFGSHYPQSVLAAGGLFHLWYEIDNDQSAIYGTCYSSSADGYNWTPCETVVDDFVAMPDEPWCSGGSCLPKPKSVLLDGSIFEAWYQRQGALGLGYATASASEPPTAICQDALAAADAVCAAAVETTAIDDGSFDPAGGPLTFELLPPSPYPLGTTEVTLVVTGDGGADECTAEVVVDDLSAPVITLAGDANVELECGADFEDPLGTVADNCDADLDLVVGGDTVDTNAPGTYTVEYTATDLSGNPSEPALRTVIVTDSGAPTIASASATPAILWPPNHRMVDIAVTVAASDTCDAAPICRVVEVTSNEPVNGKGDGNTAPDWEIVSDSQVRLRAERSGKGSGRVYSITSECSDASGQSATVVTQVLVPKSQGKR